MQNLECFQQNSLFLQSPSNKRNQAFVKINWGELFLQVEKSCFNVTTKQSKQRAFKFLSFCVSWHLLGSISSHFGSPVFYPPPNYGWITGPQPLSVTSHRLLMQITTLGGSVGKKWQSLLLCTKLNLSLLVRMCSMWKCFGQFREKRKTKTLFQSYKKSQPARISTQRVSLQ